jgi:hypothetical protein
VAGDLGAAENDRLAVGSARSLHGGNPAFATAAVDTYRLLGPWNSGADYNGQFEDQSAFPAWNGWTSDDRTALSQSQWQAATQYAVNGAYSAWCGSAQFDPCSPFDPVGGYGNNWSEKLEWRGTVADPAAGCQLQVIGVLDHDTEQGYDYLTLGYENGSGDFFSIWMTDGTAENVALDVTATLAPTDYAGENNDEVVLQFRFTSDGAFSDEDCQFFGKGACQLDDLLVSVDNGGLATFDDFEGGTLGNWTPRVTMGTGDFAQIWSFLEDVDPCRSNYSPQVAFIDDGVVVPGTGGSTCIDWCYGPGGYIVTTTQGLAESGSGLYLDNVVLSPVMTWPGSQYSGALLSFDAFIHETLTLDSPFIFGRWQVRSTAASDPADIVTAPWRDWNSLLWGPGTYQRISEEVSELLVAGPQHVQVALGVYELGYVWGVVGDNGYPAPYFDNVHLDLFAVTGPAIRTTESALANDGFPAGGVLDTVDLGANSVRFDMAANIALPEHLRIDPGDSVVITVKSLRAGAALTSPPLMHYKLAANPLFDPFRTAGLAIEGTVTGLPVGLGGEKWAFDLPDTGFLYPGDILHYYFTATDDVDGLPEASFLPADLSGYGVFDDPLAYDPSFTVRALPSLTSDGFGGLEQPDLLFWNDYGDPQARAEWHDAIVYASTSPYYTFTYDTYYTNAPRTDLGNGLGGRATAAQLDGYETILYSAGDLGAFTLGNGDFQGTPRTPSPDVQLLTAWLQSGERNLVLTGDDLANHLSRSGAASQNFLANELGLVVTTGNIRPFINNQATPLVWKIPGTGLLDSIDEWVAYGGCLDLNEFDGVEPIGAAVRLAEFIDPVGNPGMYSYSAMTINENPASGDRVITLPYDLTFVYSSQGAPPPVPQPARNLLLKDMLCYFGRCPIIDGVPDAAAVFGVRNHPNPFNPLTTISYTMPRQGHLSLKVFDVRGALVRTLVDAVRPAGEGRAVWDGKNGQGAQVASGVYFYEARTGDEVQIRKMALVK